MRQIIRKYFKSIYKDYLFYNRTKAFEKRYKNIEKSLFHKTLGNDIIKKYKEKWNAFEKKVEIDTFLLCYNISGKIDYNIIPENLFAAVIEPMLNPYKELSFFSTKNVYEKWFTNSEIFPETYFHKIGGIYYSRDFEIIDDLKKYLQKIDLKLPCILKPSRETYGGANVKPIYSIEGLLSEVSNSNNLIAQEKIEQHEYLNRINPSINSIRTCLYRTKSGKYKVINNSIRFGIDGGLDNLKAGGIVCNIDNNGVLNNYATDIKCRKYHKHPNSNIVFSNLKIPFYNELIKTAEVLANQVPLSNILSLDMCLDKNDKWRCLELNVRAQTIRFVQYAGKGFFGEYTDEVIKKTK